ncbi:MAG TPA: NUDIX hydrolase [Candidatus Saccharimonadales bacterium]|nr:NUDIX hydrolase [Candidatus Saccharimonadales bacterium]
MINCTFENGSNVLLRHITVGALVINDKNQVLLIKRAEHLPNGGKYGIPGGFLDRDETIEEGTLRELKEETGLDGEILTLFQIIDTPNRQKEDRQNIQFNYIVKVKEGVFNKNSEVEESRWVNEEDLPAEEDSAFDHSKSVKKYFEYLKKPFDLPLFGY